MDTYQVRVSLGKQWCLHIGDEVDAVRVDRLVQVESAARAWIAERQRVGPDSFAVALEFVPT